MQKLPEPDLAYLQKVLLEMLAIPSPTGFTDTIVRYVAERLEEIGARPSIGTVADSYDCEHRDCATIWGLTLAYDRPCGCPRVDVSAPGGGVHQAAGRVGSDLIGA